LCEQSNTSWRWCKSFSKDFDVTSTGISSRYTKQQSRARPARTTCMIRCNIAGVLQSPKGMPLNSYNLQCVVEAVLAWEFGSSSTCQYQDTKSSVVKYLACLTDSRMSSTLGEWIYILLVALFKQRLYPTAWAVQKCRMHVYTT